MFTDEELVLIQADFYPTGINVRPTEIIPPMTFFRSKKGSFVLAPPRNGLCFLWRIDDPAVIAPFGFKPAREEDVELFIKMYRLNKN